MAKKKKKKQSGKQKGAADRSASESFPKEIAGVQVPQSLRNAGAQMRELAKDPIVSDLIAAGLLAAATSLSQSKAGKKARSEASDTASHVADDVAATGGAVKQALIGIVRDVIDAIETSGKDKKPGA